MDLLDSRATTLKLEELGRWYTGTAIAEIEETQRHEYVKGGGGRPLYWHDKRPVPGMSHDGDGRPNEPVKQYEITVDVGEPDQYGSTERTLYIAKPREIKAFKEAWRKAGMPRGSSVVGCRIAARWTGTEPGQGTEEAKTYEYRIQPPPDGPKPRAVAAAPAPGPAAAPVEPQVHTGATPPSNVTAAGPSHPGPTTGGGRPAGIDPAAWAAMNPAQQQQMRQALGLTTDQPAGPPPASSPSLSDEPPF